MMRSPSSASATKQRTQAFGRDEQGLDVALRRSVDKRRARGKLADVREELTLALLGDRRQMAQAVALGDRDQALEHDEHAGTDLSRFEQLLAVRIFADRPIAPQSVDFLRRQRRETSPGSEARERRRRNRPYVSTICAGCPWIGASKIVPEAVALCSAAVFQARAVTRPKHVMPVSSAGALGGAASCRLTMIALDCRSGSRNAARLEPIRR